jgi:hypothetical protein
MNKQYFAINSQQTHTRCYVVLRLKAQKYSLFDRLDVADPGGSSSSTTKKLITKMNKF